MGYCVWRIVCPADLRKSACPSQVKCDKIDGEMKRGNQMRSLIVYLKQYKKESILAPLFKMLEASFELLVPLVMAAVIDVGIGNRDSSYIVRMCLVLIGLGLVGLVCSITAQYFSAKAAAIFLLRRWTRLGLPR